MTLTASRDEREPANIRVRTTYGPVTNEVVEAEGHVASFWSQLGRLLAQNPAHAEARARAAYERYMHHCEATGETLSSGWSWEGLDQAGREHWTEALRG